MSIGPAIYVVPDPEAAVMDASCQVATKTGVNSSIDGMATWVATRPGIVGSGPSAITVGGQTGQLVDVAVAPTWTRMCPILDRFATRQNAQVPYIALIHGVTGDDPPWEFGPNRPARQRYIFVDLRGGGIVAIILDAGPAEFDPFVADAMPIVQSMTFRP